MGDQGLAPLLALAGNVLSAGLIAWGIVTRSRFLVLLGLALSALILGIRVGTTADWWTGEVVTFLAFLAIGILVFVLSRR